MVRLVSSVILLVAVVGAGQAAGQSALERLEREIRSRLAPSVPGAPEAPPGAKPRPSPPVPARADGPPSAQDKAYFGALTADALDRGRGVRVTEVAPGSPAQAAGIQPGDLLTGVGGVRIRTQEDFDEIMREVRLGMTLTVEMLRGKEPHKVNVTFVRPAVAKPPAVAAPGAVKPKPDGSKPGVPLPANARTVAKPGEALQPVSPLPPAPKIPPPPPEPPKAGPSSGPPPNQPVAGGLPALVPPGKAKLAVPGDTVGVEARLSALEARLRQLEERIARLEEALRSAAPKAKP